MSSNNSAVVIAALWRGRPAFVAAVEGARYRFTRKLSRARVWDADREAFAQTWLAAQALGADRVAAVQINVNPFPHV